GRSRGRLVGSGAAARRSRRLHAAGARPAHAAHGNCRYRRAVRRTVPVGRPRLRAQRKVIVLISQARIVNEGKITDADVLVHKGRIEKIAPFIAAPPRTKVLDAKGKLLLPGVIDDQVHFREPGFPAKADMASESAAAVAGGTTSFMDMPNTDPKTVTRELLKDKYARADKRASANYAFYFGATNDNIEEIKALRKNDACGVKIFMGASTGNMLVDDPKTLENIFTHCAL